MALLHAAQNMKQGIKRCLPTSVLKGWRAFHNERMKTTRSRIARQACSGILQRERQPLKVELGSGPVTGQDGWVTFDNAPGADVVLDLTGPWPLPNESIAEIYSSHFLEHLSDQELDWVFSESKRVLMRGGKFDAAVPNARLYIDAYLKGDDVRSIQPDLWMPALRGTTGLAVVNYMAYMGGEHRRMFDENSLVAELVDAGFVDVSLRAFDPSRDLEGRRHETIYVTARKG